MMIEQMKPSGIDWIGEIPTDWNIKRVKYLASLKGRIGWQGLTSDEYIDEGPFLITGIDFCNGGIDWENCVHISEERWAEAPEIHIHNGDLLITKDGTIGKVAIVDNLTTKASLNSGVLLIRPQADYDKKFLFWVLQSDEFWTWFKLKNAGNSTIVHLYQGDFAEFSYTFPRGEEQKAIANYLDAQCSKFDSIISDIEKQIDTLQKHKKSLITETVTKGCAQKSKTKVADLDFTDRINEEWIVTRIKYLCEMYSGENLTSTDIEPEGAYPVYGGNGLRGFYSQYTNDGEYVLIGRQGALCGNVHLVSGKFWATDHAVVTYPNKDVCNGFLFYLFSAMDLNQYSQTAAQPGLAVAAIQNLKTCIPPTIDLQKMITSFLDKKCGRIDEIICQKQKQLRVIAQHKRSLIYEYVTGKKRITEVK